MLIRDVMTPYVELVSLDTTIAEAARVMLEDDIGAIPIAEDDRLVGFLTDRDIVVRAIAQGKDPDNTKVREAMSEGVLYCFDDQTVDEVCANLGEQQVRRLAVVDREKNLVGIVSLGDLSLGGATAPAAEALERISEPSR